jgi:hypothetical protein
LRCIACNKSLSDFESTRKSTETGEFIDLCNFCYSTIQNDAPSAEREDLRDEEIINPEVDNDPFDLD